MPCDSIITRTQMTRLDRLTEALKALGYNNISSSQGGLRVDASGAGLPRISFTRGSPNAGFVTRDSDTIAERIGKKYAELGVRAWARRAGYNVLSLEDDRMTLVNRRSR